MDFRRLGSTTPLTRSQEGLWAEHQRFCKQHQLLFHSYWNKSSSTCWEDARSQAGERAPPPLHKWNTLWNVSLPGSSFVFCLRFGLLLFSFTLQHKHPLISEQQAAAWRRQQPGWKRKARKWTDNARFLQSWNMRTHHFQPNSPLISP